MIKEIRPDLIGFTVTTPLKRGCGEISKLIKSSYNIPIVWGGPDPTIDPESSLDYCDFVCVGEGEKTIADIATRIDSKRDIKEARNLVYRENGKFIRNPLYGLISDLDKLTFKDISPDNKILIDNNHLVRNFSEVSYTRNFRYHAISSRGCMFNCSFCCEEFYKKLYSPEKFLRRRSPSNVVRELKEARKIIHYKIVHFEDEIFSFDHDWLKEFKDIYKKEINVPIMCYIYPDQDIKRKLELLKEGGLIRTCLSLQSGSERINREIFNRPFNKYLFLETAQLLKTMGIDYYVDVITYNPFEDEEDLQATLDILNKLPKPSRLCVNKLYLSKGTKIYKLVKNLQDKKENKIVSDRVFNYYSRLFWSTTGQH